MKLLILDFDGTLANTVPHVINCIQKCIKKFGLKEMTYDDILKFNGAVLGDVMISLGAKKEQLLEIKQYYCKIFLEDLSDIELYSKVYDTLKELKENVIITMATNRGRNTLIPLLEFLGIDQLIEYVICESDVENKKPYPDMVDKIKEIYNISDEDILVVGDTKFDIMMGKNANCKTCGIYYEQENLHLLAENNPNYLIDDFSKLIDIIKLNNENKISKK